jgi:acyl carrier protein
MTNNQLLAIFREVFARQDLDITAETTPADIKEWDSFNHINLIIRIEEEYNISFDTDEIGKIGRVGDLIRAICQKTGDTT